MPTGRILLIIPLIVTLLSACNNDDATKTAAISHVDSAAQSAPDTLRASTDTTSHKDSARKL